MKRVTVLSCVGGGGFVDGGLGNVGCGFGYIVVAMGALGWDALT